VRRVVDIAKAVKARQKADALGDVSAGLSFWAFLSLFPAVLALLGYLDLFVSDHTADDVRKEITDAIDNALTGDTAAELKRTALDIVNNPRGGLAIVGLAGALFSMGKGFSGLCRALARIRGSEPRPMVLDRVVGVGLGFGTLLVLLILVLQVVVGPLFGFERLLPEEGSKQLLHLWEYVFRWPALLLVTVGWVTVLLKVGSRDKGGWRRHLPGALFAVAFWGVITLGFRLAVQLGLLRANPILGAIGGVILFLSWLNLMSTGILLGGEVNVVVAAERQARAAPGAMRPASAVGPTRAAASGRPGRPNGRLGAVAATALLLGGLLNRPKAPARRR